MSKLRKTAVLTAGLFLASLAPAGADGIVAKIVKSPLNAAGLDALNAGRLYINVHSPDYPPGEVRGQIVPDGITVLFTELSGEQEVPAVDTRASGLAAITLDESSSMVSIHVNNEGLDDAKWPIGVDFGANFWPEGQPQNVVVGAGDGSAVEGQGSRVRVLERPQGAGRRDVLTPAWHVLELELARRPVFSGR